MNELAFLLAGASLGIIVFQSAVLAPLVFTQLKDGSSGPFLRARVFSLSWQPWGWDLLLPVTSAVLTAVWCWGESLWYSP